MKALHNLGGYKMYYLSSVLHYYLESFVKYRIESVLFHFGFALATFGFVRQQIHFDVSEQNRELYRC